MKIEISSLISTMPHNLLIPITQITRTRKTYLEDDNNIYT